jgi:hypothetical protein
MLKRIPKSDISFRPFKSFKDWRFTSSSRGDVSVLSTEYSTYYIDGNNTSDGSLEFNKLSLFGQLRGQFYNGQEDNPFKRFGYKTNIYTDNPVEKERYLSDKIKVISIPQKCVGEGIKPGSVSLKITADNDEIWELTDDGYSNLLITQADVLNVSLLDFETGQFNFTNYRTGTPYSTSVDSNNWNLDNGEIRITSGGIDYDTILYSWDANASPSLMYVKNLEFLEGQYGLLYAGNIFYHQGLITITRETDILLNKDWSLDYKSTLTNYEYEYLLVVDGDEFNVSTNPSAVVEVGSEYSTFAVDGGKRVRVNPVPGVKYIRKLLYDNNNTPIDYRYTGSISTSSRGGFGDWEYSGSIDKTGSYLAPFITTIGLYDDDCSLLAVAKLAKPVKSFPDIPINFIVRFDT